MHLAPPPALLYWILSLGLCAACSSETQSSLEILAEGWCVRDGGREGDTVVTSIIHNGIARETGCEGIGESDQYEITHLSTHRANEPDPSSAICFHSISQGYKCIEPVKMPNDCIDSKRGCFFSLYPTSREFNLLERCRGFLFYEPPS